MSQIALNKSNLSVQKRQKAAFQRYLPALELKQKQLLAERKKAEQAFQEHQQQIALLESEIYRKIPMLAESSINLYGLVKVTHIEVRAENLLGTILPQLHNIEFSRAPYGFLARPHWVDEVVKALENMLRLKIEAQLLEKRVIRLVKASRTITQRVNLFSKVLIPESEKTIGRIELFLADQERAAVVRSKLAKQKHQQA